ncbi:TRAP-type transporter, periplasmic solute binding receptor (TAXI family protein) [Desulfatibacillum aliphaticivorans]|uniref:TRAP-type transporter, periplasmic solute binding receptor (TAXI family protein) n=1 Tax=Desulfatibacillum aliphaticivorans TaxID=218208 RepID=B8F9G6_DESAL|nr:TAXI family TRAP transporter solute-binding subunit [Desulfatibacillum aliphaticivorans]ACL02912.1 TRAP-type transporter, periplasmic solute binding receptor (TAXI family protein) [Desulfatibacillum aliphaticivorans]
MKKALILFIAVLFCITGFGPAFAKTFVTIGTGGVTGVYYPTGGAISRMVNQKSSVYDIKATVESTGGSVYNINAVLSGDLEFGIAQSDRQFQAINGMAEWEQAGPQKDLRAVFSIHPELMTCVARADLKAKDFGDLKGKRVNIGNPGSGQLQNSKDVLEAYGMTEDDIVAEYAKAVEAPSLLQDEKIDAFVYTVGHPNGNIKEATSGRIKVSIVPIAGAGLDAVIAKYPYYAKSFIKVENYPNAVNDADVPSIGVKATLVSSANVSDDVVYAVTKEVFDNLEAFKKLHPAYAVLNAEEMLQGLSAPIHPGALKYYKEAGLVKYIKPELIK